MTTCSRFYVNLVDDNGDLPLQVSVLLKISMQSKITVLNWKASGVFGPDPNYLFDPNPPFPFTAGVQFHMRITATGTHQLSVSCWTLCVRACLRACVPACLRACVRACVRVCVSVCLEVSLEKIMHCVTICISIIY